MFIFRVCFFIFLFLFLVQGATDSIQYRMNGNRYAVVVPLGDGVGEKEAKRAAYEQAAQMTVQGGYRFFTVASEGKVGLIQSDNGGADRPGNIYQELIIENDFDRERLRDRAIPNQKVTQGYRLVFEIAKEKRGGKTIDSCQWTQCP